MPLTQAGIDRRKETIRQDNERREAERKKEAEESEQAYLTPSPTLPRRRPVSA